MIGKGGKEGREERWEGEEKEGKNEKWEGEEKEGKKEEKGDRELHIHRYIDYNRP